MLFYVLGQYYLIMCPIMKATKQLHRKGLRVQIPPGSKTFLNKAFYGFLNG